MTEMPSTAPPPGFPGAPAALRRDPVAIEVAGLARSFGAVAAVRDVSFTAAPGAVTALIGPNGAGKTTLLLLLATLLRPDAGTIRVGSIDPVASPRAARPLIGWMPDQLGSWSNLTARTALTTTVRMYGHPRAHAAARAAALIELVGLGELAERPTRVLSRGQKQKLSLARALADDPAVLLLDEPASGLDPVARVELRELLLRLAGEGRTVLISSHVLAELDEMATAAVYLDHGVTASVEAVARARAASRVWRVKAAPDTAGAVLDAASVARALEAVGVPRERLAVDAQGATVTAADDADAAAVLAALVGSGVPVSWFAPASGELERTLQGLVEGGRS